MDPDKRGAGAGGYSPAIVFAVLLILVVTGAIFLTTRQEPPQPKAASSPEATPSPTTHRLTDAEAIARFKELDALRLNSYRAREVSPLDGVFVPNSPPDRIARREIEMLRRRNLLSRSRFDTRVLTVVRNRSNSIILHQVVVIYPKLVTEQGREVTTSRSPRRQTLRWVMTWDGEDWKISDSVVTASWVVAP